MAGTVTYTSETSDMRGDKTKSYEKIQWSWTSTAGGVADKATTETYTGHVFLCVTDPDDSAAPTDLYDITITDGDGVDVLNGDGADRATATTEQFVAFGFVFNSTLTLNVTNAGNAKSGVVTLYVGP